MKLSLEDFQQLSTEIEHLVRAEMPLEQSLAAASDGRGKRLMQAADVIMKKLEAGESLAEIVADKSLGVPRILSSAIAAGVRSNNLAVTIELMGTFAADIIQLRQRLLSALTYPIAIVATAGVLTMVFLTSAMERLYESIQELEIPVDSWLMKLLQWNNQYPEWVLIFPAIAVVFILLWLFSGRASSLTFRGPERLLLLLPGVGALIRDLQQYTMTRMMSLLTARDVPLDEAVLLAGGASGNAKLQLACDEVAEQIRAGRSLGEQPKHNVTSGQSDGFQYKEAMNLFASRKTRKHLLPPLLEASLAQVDRNEACLSQRLHSVAEFYRGRLERNATWIRMLMPVAAFIVIGGGSVVLYASALFWPVAQIYSNFGQ